MLLKTIYLYVIGKEASFSTNNNHLETLTIRKLKGVENITICTLEIEHTQKVT